MRSSYHEIETAPMPGGRTNWKPTSSVPVRCTLICCASRSSASSRISCQRSRSAARGNPRPQVAAAGYLCRAGTIIQCQRRHEGQWSVIWRDRPQLRLPTRCAGTATHEDYRINHFMNARGISRLQFYRRCGAVVIGHRLRSNAVRFPRSYAVHDPARILTARVYDVARARPNSISPEPVGTFSATACSGAGTTNRCSPSGAAPATGWRSYEQTTRPRRDSPRPPAGSTRRGRARRAPQARHAP